MLDGLQAGRAYSPSILFVVSRQGTRGIILVRLLCPVAVRTDGFFSGENQVAEACVWMWWMKAATPLVGCWGRRHFPTAGPQFLRNTDPWFAHRPDDVRQPLVAEFCTMEATSRATSRPQPLSQVPTMVLRAALPSPGPAPARRQASHYVPVTCPGALGCGHCGAASAAFSASLRQPLPASGAKPVILGHPPKPLVPLVAARPSNRPTVLHHCLRM